MRDDSNNSVSGLDSSHFAHVAPATLVQITSPTKAASVSGAHGGRCDMVRLGSLIATTLSVGAPPEEVSDDCVAAGRSALRSAP